MPQQPEVSKIEFPIANSNDPVLDRMLNTLSKLDQNQIGPTANRLLGTIMAGGTRCVTMFADHRVQQIKWSEFVDRVAPNAITPEETLVEIQFGKQEADTEGLITLLSIGKGLNMQLGYMGEHIDKLRKFVNSPGFTSQLHHPDKKPQFSPEVKRKAQEIVEQISEIRNVDLRKAVRDLEPLGSSYSNLSVDVVASNNIVNVLGQKPEEIESRYQELNKMMETIFETQDVQAVAGLFALMDLALGFHTVYGRSKTDRMRVGERTLIEAGQEIAKYFYKHLSMAQDLHHGIPVPEKDRKKLHEPLLKDSLFNTALLLFLTQYTAPALPYNFSEMGLGTYLGGVNTPVRKLIATRYQEHFQGEYTILFSDRNKGALYKGVLDSYNNGSAQEYLGHLIELGTPKPKINPLGLLYPDGIRRAPSAFTTLNQMATKEPIVLPVDIPGVATITISSYNPRSLDFIVTSPTGKHLIFQFSSNGWLFGLPEDIVRMASDVCPYILGKALDALTAKGIIRNDITPLGSGQPEVKTKVSAPTAASATPVVSVKEDLSSLEERPEEAVRVDPTEAEEVARREKRKAQGSVVSIEVYVPEKKEKDPRYQVDIEAIRSILPPRSTQLGKRLRKQLGAVLSQLQVNYRDSNSSGLSRELLYYPDARADKRAWVGANHRVGFIIENRSGIPWIVVTDFGPKAGNQFYRKLSTKEPGERKKEVRQVKIKPPTNKKTRR